MKKRITFLLTFTLLCLTAVAQTDYTTKITNPSFENEWTGWEHKNLGLQGNSVFDIKAGNIYAEKWTGRGGKVGSAHASQILTDLPPGNYELSAAAQNIQEDTPKTVQSGAWIFAGDNKTKVTVRDTYTVTFTYVTGEIKIGFEAVDATGNWISVDNFRLTLVGDDLSKELTAAIESALVLYGDGSGKEAEQLKSTIDAAQDVANNAASSGEEQANAIKALLDAEETYKRANASEENPYDLTSLIINPSFETGDLTGWTSSGMGTQGNSVFNIKQGNTYVERWTSRGSAVGDARLSQILKGMRPGRYRLMAAAQNIQEDTPKQEQTGAWIYANTHQTAVTIRQDYTLEFVLVSDQLEIGFKAESATGNWLAVDNFRLQFISDSFDEVKTEFTNLIALAESVASQKTNATIHNTLVSAIDNAKALLAQDNADDWGVAARELEEALHTAESSAEVFARLYQAITEAQNEIEGSTSSLKENYEKAIGEALNTYNDDATTDAQAEAAIATLLEAGFAFKIENGTGDVPTVTTDKRFIRGSVWAFGRSTVKGSNIIEEGFCWAENPDPKVTDNRTTEYLNQAGKVYWLRDLKPATVYYMRAYAITKEYAVGYGDVIKFVTVPKGTIGYWYNNGGDEATNERLSYATERSMNYYWNSLSSIHDFGITVNYSPGTPTADCSYGGWMRVGESSSYQQIGTIMHEAFHGIGVGTHNMWWNGEMRSAGNRGDWLGDRVTEAVRFWDNSTTAVITGDDMHLWPYGCNGAHEDTHNDNLYCMMGILAQALNEDGLPGSDAIGYALPYYSFNHEEGVKYYIKNEDENHGLYTSYLVETDNHQLQWKSMAAEDAAADDHAAWYLTFTPGNQYYQLKNAATGYYMTYNSGFKVAKHTTPTSADNIHLMRGRVDVSGYRGYYFIHPESSANPPVLVANANGKTTNGSFNIAKSATTQRWLILSAEEAQQFEASTLDISKKELNNLLAEYKKLAQTPHTEEAEGVDEAFQTTLAGIEAKSDAATNPIQVEELLAEAREAAMSFLENVSATDIEQPFNLTFMLQNPDFDKDATTGWTTNATPGYGGGGAEFYEKTFNFYQTLKGMPSGVYQLRANAFQRPGEPSAVYTQYKAGTRNISTQLYIGSAYVLVKHICDDSQKKSLHSDDKQLATGVYVPNVMNGAAQYFAKGLYDNSVNLEQTTSGANLNVGIRSSKSGSYYWTMFDHFRLYFFGKNRTVVGVEGIQSQPTERWNMGDAIYDLSGRKVTNPSKGLYIINGRRILVR